MLRSCQERSFRCGSLDRQMSWACREAVAALEYDETFRFNAPALLTISPKKFFYRMPRSSCRTFCKTLQTLATQGTQPIAEQHKFKRLRRRFASNV